jgi:hypothetical protein
MQPQEQDQDRYAQVKPRNLDPNPRCYECKSDDLSGRAPMFHPAHRWGPCEVRMPGGELCPHEEPSATLLRHRTNSG